MSDKTGKASPFDGIEFALESDIMPALLAHETRRLETAKKVKTVIAAIVIVTAVLIIITAAAVKSGKMILNMPPFIAIGGTASAIWAWTYFTKPLKLSAKYMLVGGLTGFLRWSYDAAGFTPLSVAGFRALGLLPGRGTAQKIEDQITGRVGEKYFVMHEMTLRTEGKNKVTTFQGQIFVVDCDRSFTGQTLVLRDRSKFGRASRGAIPGLKRAGLASPKFEKLFEVYTTDQVEARYLLPPDFMERIMDLEASVDGNNIRFAFSKGKLYIAVETGNWFEPHGTFHSYTDREPARKIIRELRAIHALIDELS